MSQSSQLDKLDFSKRFESCNLAIDDVVYAQCMFHSMTSSDAQECFSRPIAVQSPLKACCNLFNDALGGCLPQTPNAIQCHQQIKTSVSDMLQCSVPAPNIALGVVAALFIGCLLFLRFFRQRAKWPRLTTFVTQTWSLFVKDLQIYRQNWIRRLVMGQLLPLTLIMALVGVIFLMDPSVPSIESFRINQFLPAIQIEYVIPTTFRRSLFGYMKPLMGLFFLVILTNPVAGVLSDMVRERQSHMRDALRLTGVGLFPIWLAQFIARAVLLFPMVLALSVIGIYGDIFPHESIGALFLFWMAQIQGLNALMSILSIFFKNSQPAIIAAVAVLFGLYGATFKVTELDMEMKKVAALFAAPLGMSMILDSMVHGSSMSHIEWMIYRNANHLDFTSTSSLAYSFFHIVFYSLLAWYLDEVFNNTRRHPLFLFRKEFWAFNKTKLVSHDEDLNPALEEDENSVLFEATTQEEKDMLQEKRCVRLLNLTRAFGNYKAVNNLNGEFYENQITALLGANGAGKSTTFSMLTGVTAPTSGHVVMYGRSMQLESDVCRQMIGFCPQYNWLYPTLTVRQHLSLFAALRNMEPVDAEFEIQKLCSDMNLTEKMNAPVQSMSGGQRRKLCIALALLGGSKVVILDEPTAAMDPLSRRQVWDVLKRYRKDRVMILTSHFLDECDYLGDRVLILSHGRLQCAGSSLFLKSHLGQGYKLTVQDLSGRKDVELVRKTLNATISESERLDVPVHEASMMAAEHGHVTCSYESYLPPSLAHQFGDLLRALESLSFTSVSLVPPTLEDVFLKVTSATVNGNQLQLKKGESLPPASFATIDSWREPSDDAEAGSVRRKTPTCWTLLIAMLMKRWLLARHDKRLWLVVCVLPVVFLSMPLLLPIIPVVKYIVNDPPPAVGPAQCLANFSQAFVSTSNYATCCEAKNTFADIFGANSDNSYEKCVLQGIPFCVTDHSQIQCRKKFAYCQYMPFLCNVDICCDATNIYSPLYPCRQSESNINEKCMPNNWAVIQLQVTAFMNSIMACFAMTFIPILATYHLVWEREAHHNTRFQQFASGVGRGVYWFGQWVWDHFLMTIICLVALGCFQGYSLFQLHLPGEVLPPWLLAAAILFFYTLAMLPVCYYFSFWFVDSGKAIIGITVFTLATGPGLGIITYLLRILDFDIRGTSFNSYALVQNVLRYVLGVFPPYNLLDGLIMMQTAPFRECLNKLSHETDSVGPPHPGTNLNIQAIRQIIDGKTCQGIEISEIDVLMVPSAFLLGCAVVFWILLCIKEIRWSSAIASKEKPPVDETEPEDVKRERNRVLAQKPNQRDTVAIIGLGKRFKTKLAVADMNLGIRMGECFGLLGSNGCGKSTTMRMLTGQERPQYGRAYLDQCDIYKGGPKTIGYCPQYDAQFDFLTVYEHLQMYAKIRGVPSSFIEHWIRGLQLDRYRHTASIHLSGGNRRKLSLAMAMIGSPAVAFLDEVSTGLDAYSKRFLWHCVRGMARDGGSAIMLTTHAMEEAEALSDRIGIMIDGRLKCLGTASYIKNKFSTGFSLEAMFTEDGSTEHLMTFLSKMLHVPVTVVEQHPNRAVLRIEKGETDLCLSILFDWLESHKTVMNMTSYIVGMCSLDEVFNSFALQQSSMNK